MPKFVTVLGNKGGSPGPPVWQVQGSFSCLCMCCCKWQLPVPKFVAVLGNKGSSPGPPVYQVQGSLSILILTLSALIVTLVLS